MPVHLSGLPPVLKRALWMPRGDVCALLRRRYRRRSIQHKHRVEAVLGPEGARVVLFSWGPPAKELLLLSKPLLNWFFRAQLRVLRPLRCQKTATTKLNWFFASLTQDDAVGAALEPRQRLADAAGPVPPRGSVVPSRSEAARRRDGGARPAGAPRGGEPRGRRERSRRRRAVPAPPARRRRRAAVAGAVTRTQAPVVAAVGRPRDAHVGVVPPSRLAAAAAAQERRRRVAAGPAAPVAAAGTLDDEAPAAADGPVPFAVNHMPRPTDRPLPLDFAWAPRV